MPGSKAGEGCKEHGLWCEIGAHKWIWTGRANKPVACPEHRKESAYWREQRWKWAQDPEEIRRYHREYYHTAELCERFREQNSEKDRRWRQANPKLVRQQCQRRQMRKSRQYVEDIDRSVLFCRDVGICQICHEPISDRDLVLDWLGYRGRLQRKRPSEDHIWPLSRGGMHCYRNVQLAHHACNASKGNRIVSDSGVQERK